MELIRERWINNGLSQSGKNNYNIVGDVLGGKYKIARVPFVMEDDKLEAERHANLISASPELYNALAKLLKHYKELVDSGDCGFWNAEDEKEYIEGINAINKALNGK